MRGTGILAGGVVAGFVMAFVVLAFLLGPYCLAYDLNHLVPLISGKPLNISMWNPAVFIGGVIFSETAVPVAVIVWILIVVGVLV